MDESHDGGAALAVVVVDDDDHVRAALCGLLRSAGLSVLAFRSVEDMAAGLGGQRAGCLILDVQLPGQSGISFFEERAGVDGAIPTIFISGHADALVRSRAREAGAIGFFMKPVRYEELLNAVEIALGQNRTEPE